MDSLPVPVTAKPAVTQVSQQIANSCLPVRIDMRETALKASLMVAATSAALPVGDVWVGCSGEHIATGGIVLERKTVADFDASIKDGRYDEQRGRMLAYAQEHGAKVAYVVEGTLADSSLGREALVKKVATAELIYGIPVFRTFSPAETARLVETLLTMWSEGKFTGESVGRAQRAADGIHIVKKQNVENPHQFALQILCQCPGLSVKAGEALLAEFGSLKAILAAEETELATVKVGTRRLGPAVARRFCELFKELR